VSENLSIWSVEMTHKEADQELEHATRRGVVLYEQNPFMLGIQTRTKRITNKRGDMMLINNDGVIQSQIAGFWESEEVDTTRFIKLFVDGVKGLAELSNAGTRIFEVLYTEMQKNIGKDQIYMSYTGLDRKQKIISRSTFSRGLSELIDKRFIAAMPAVGWYWVNPDFIWNGDRIAFMKEYRKIGTKRQPLKDERTADLFSAPSTDHSPVLPDALTQAPQE
jgi:hypothetical protein